MLKLRNFIFWGWTHPLSVPLNQLRSQKFSKFHKSWPYSKKLCIFLSLRVFGSPEIHTYDFLNFDPLVWNWNTVAGFLFRFQRSSRPGCGFNSLLKDAQPSQCEKRVKKISLLFLHTAWHFCWSRTRYFQSSPRWFFILAGWEFYQWGFFLWKRRFVIYLIRTRLESLCNQHRRKVIFRGPAGPL